MVRLKVKEERFEKGFPIETLGVPDITHLPNHPTIPWII
jgi:hypothetical protein